MSTETERGPVGEILSAARSGAPDAPATVAVAGCRRIIDDLDTRILALLRERMIMSTRVQALRLAAGGARIEHEREDAVLARYRDRLGPAGSDLALTLLTLCRGPGPRPAEGTAPIPSRAADGGEAPPPPDPSSAAPRSDPPRSDPPRPGRSGQARGPATEEMPTC